jgi:hypothetical protein
MLARIGTLAVALVVGVGCAAPVGPAPNAGYVLLDREARAKGMLSVAGFRGAPALPISAEPGESVVYQTPDESRPIEPEAQMLAYVHGSNGQIEWMRLGEGARADSLILEGDGAAAATLARMVGGTVAQAAVGRHRVSVSDAYFKLAFSKEPEGLAEAFPDLVAAGTSPIAASSSDQRLVDDAARAARRAPDFVGLYFHDGKLLVLDASGQYTLDPRCPDEDRPTGRYREDAGRIVLEGADGATTLLVEGDDLVEASGRRFALMRPEVRRKRMVQAVLPEEYE